MREEDVGGAGPGGAGDAAAESGGPDAAQRRLRALVGAEHLGAVGSPGGAVPGVDLGEEFRDAGGIVVGAALVVGGELVGQVVQCGGGPVHAAPGQVGGGTSERGGQDGARVHGALQEDLFGQVECGVEVVARCPGVPPTSRRISSPVRPRSSAARNAQTASTVISPRTAATASVWT